MANFTASLMSDGERIVVERRQHWLVLVDRSKLAILGLVVALLIFIFRGNLGTDGIGGGLNSDPRLASSWPSSCTRSSSSSTSTSTGSTTRSS